MGRRPGVLTTCTGERRGRLASCLDNELLTKRIIDYYCAQRSSESLDYSQRASFPAVSSPSPCSTARS